ncbi:MAG: hypothetical protein HQM09_17980 [Candidatus Riflebacteria bacterium]|nr:hypothetical protein [Candidatus Riflebacteria bacterium]
MRRFRLSIVLVALAVLVSPAIWAVTADELVKHFEESQKWVKSAMVAFQIQKKASDPKIADLYEFVSDKSYDYEAMVVNGDEYKNADKGTLNNLLNTIGNGVLAVVHKLATDDHKNLFKPTWIGYHTPGDKRVSNWFCLIMGNQIKTYLTRVDQRSKLDEIGADPLQMNLLNKDFFSFEVAKDMGDHAILRITPKAGADSNVKEAMVELSKVQIGNTYTWYATKISGTLTTGATGVTEFGNIRAAIAPVGAYIGWAADSSPIGNIPVDSIGAIQQKQVNGDDKIFVFATQIKNTTYQKASDGGEYEVTLLTNFKRLHINPPVDTIAQYVTSSRLPTLEKITRKVVASH